MRVIALLTALVISVAIITFDTIHTATAAAPAWHMTFDDEFNGTAINTQKWTTGWFGSGVTDSVNTLETSCYDSKNITVKGGIASFTTIGTSSVCHNGKAMPNTSALVASNGKFEQGYGFYEARLKQPAGDALWPGWWLTGYTWPNDMEIDILEGSGDNSGGFNVHYSCATGECNMNRTKRVVPVAGATSGFHTYGAYVTPTGVKFYYDGKLVGEYKGSVPNKQRYLILGTSTSGGKVTSPKTMQVDYVRVWTRG